MSSPLNDTASASSVCPSITSFTPLSYPLPSALAFSGFLFCPPTLYFLHPSPENFPASTTSDAVNNPCCFYSFRLFSSAISSYDGRSDEFIGPLPLAGHHSPPLFCRTVPAAAAADSDSGDSPSPSDLHRFCVVSLSRTELLFWRYSDLRRVDCSGPSPTPRTLVNENQFRVVEFSPSGSELAVYPYIPESGDASDPVIALLDLSSGLPSFLISGSGASVHTIRFLSSAFLLSLSSESFRVWDLSGRDCCFTSPTFAGQRLRCLAAQSTEAFCLIAIASNWGFIRIFEFDFARRQCRERVSSNVLHQAAKLELLRRDRFAARQRSSAIEIHANRKPKQIEEEEQNAAASSAINAASLLDGSDIYSLCFAGVYDLLFCSRSLIGSFCLRSHRVKWIKAEREHAEATFIQGPAGSEPDIIALASTDDHGMLEVAVLNWRSDLDQPHNDSDPAIARADASPAPSDSPMQFCLVEAPSADSILRKHKFQSSAPAKSKSSKSANSAPLNLVFHRGIRSSGYGVQQPKIKLGQIPKPPKQIKSSKSSAASKSSKAVKSVEKSSEAFPVSVSPPSVQLSSFVQALPRPLHSAPIVGLELSADERYLSTSSQDCTVGLIRASRSSPTVRYFTGHSKPVRSTSIAVHQPFLIATAPNAIKLWPFEEKSSDTAFDLPSDNGEDWLDAAFFDGDRFLLAAIGNRIRLSKYQVKFESENSSLTSLKTNRSKVALVAEYRTTKSQWINAFRGLNATDRRSARILLGESDRTLSMMDLETGQIIAAYQNAHAKPIHFIDLFLGHQELAATVAMDSAVKLIDLRTLAPVLTISGHVNRTTRTNCAFAPDGNLIAIAAEDCSSYLFDLRQHGKMINKLQGHTQGVAAVRWASKGQSAIFSASYDGSVRLFGQPAEMP